MGIQDSICFNPAKVLVVTTDKKVFKLLQVFVFQLSVQRTIFCRLFSVLYAPFLLICLRQYEFV